MMYESQDGWKKLESHCENSEQIDRLFGRQNEQDEVIKVVRLTDEILLKKIIIKNS